MKKLLILSLLLIHSVSALAISNADTNYYPQNEIKNFLQLSSKEKFQFIKNYDIEMFKYDTGGMPAQDSSAQEFLTNVPFVDKSRFTQFKDIFDTSVLGVFFSKHNSAYGVEKDTLLLSIEADTWTIAHELSHGLIDKNRHKDKVVKEELSFQMLADAMEDYEESMRTYRNLGFFPSERNVKLAFESIKVWTTMQVELLYAFELEEVKIERALRKMYESQKSLELNKETYDRSNWYIGKNCHSAIMKIDHAKEVLDYYRSLISAESTEKYKESILAHDKYLSTHQQTIHNFCR